MNTKNMSIHPYDFDIKKIEEADDNFELYIKYEVCKGISPKLIEEYVNDFIYVFLIKEHLKLIKYVCLKIIINQKLKR